MAPLINTNEFVNLLTLDNPDSLKKFDIIVFRQQDILFAHFLWRKQNISGKESYLTRSLKNPTISDFPIEKADLVGIIIDKKLSFYHKIYVYIRNIISGTF